MKPGSLFEDEEKEEIEMIMDATPVQPRLNKIYEVLERKGDEQLPLLFLNPYLRDRGMNLWIELKIFLLLLTLIFQETRRRNY